MSMTIKKLLDISLEACGTECGSGCGTECGGPGCPPPDPHHGPHHGPEGHEPPPPPPPALGDMDRGRLFMHAARKFFGPNAMSELVRNSGDELEVYGLLPEPDKAAYASKCYTESVKNMGIVDQVALSLAKNEDSDAYHQLVSAMSAVKDAMGAISAQYGEQAKSLASDFAGDCVRKCGSMKCANAAQFQKLANAMQLECGGGCASECGGGCN